MLEKDQKFKIINGNSVDVLKEFPDNYFDSIVTDPPYGLSFMGKKWDYDVPSVELWAECLRVLKPGGHLLAFAGTRTQHRMAVRIEDAGFEIRDMIAWVYGSGFPKSLDVSKAIDKAAGAEREVVGPKVRFDGREAGKMKSMNGGAFSGNAGRTSAVVMDTAPVTEAARQWQGWGTALKPALEPITMARKSLIGTVATNVLEHGTGALNIDGCRVPVDPEADASQLRTMNRNKRDGDDGWGMSTVLGDKPQVVRSDGRWPANLIHDGSEEVMLGFPDTSPSNGAPRNNKANASIGAFGTSDRITMGISDSGGSAARFFYQAKASKKDRGSDNNHPTVKPTDLMRYLCRLVTPPNGIILDPFTGSGSTGKAAMMEGFRFVGIELDQEYHKISNNRINDALKNCDTIKTKEKNYDVEKTSSDSLMLDFD